VAAGSRSTSRISGGSEVASVAACPCDASFFAALMALANLGTAGGNYVGGWLYEAIGLTPLILVSALATAACWAIIPLIRLDGPTATATAAP